VNGVEMVFVKTGFTARVHPCISGPLVPVTWLVVHMAHCQTVNWISWLKL